MSDIKSNHLRNLDIQDLYILALMLTETQYKGIAHILGMHSASITYRLSKIRIVFPCFKPRNINSVRGIRLNEETQDICRRAKKAIELMQHHLPPTF